MLGALFRELIGLRSRGTDSTPLDVELPEHQIASLRARADQALAHTDAASAEELYREILALAPDDADARCGLGIALLGAGKAALALPELRRALSIAPERMDALHSAAQACRELDDIDAAIDFASQAVAIDEDSPRAHKALAQLFREAGEPRRAHAHAKRAMALAPDRPDLILEAALCLLELAQRSLALRLIDRALVLDPNLADAHLTRAFILLGDRQYARGWEEYAWRNSIDTTAQSRTQTLWRGQPLAGRSILVVKEQGLGDQVMFASCIPDLVSTGARVSVECDPRLVPIFARSFPDVSVSPVAEPREPPEPSEAAEDFFIPAGSLPCVFRASTDAFPRHHGYLRADHALTTRWREQLAQSGAGLKIGVAWRGGLRQTRRAFRSISPTALLDAINIQRETVYVDLQFGDDERVTRELTEAPAVDVLSWPDAKRELDEYAALISALDLVIAVSSSVIHLAGALGKPVWVLVPHVVEWRYSAAGSDMPWYPSARLYRQQSPGDWSGPLAAIRRDLETLVFR